MVRSRDCSVAILRPVEVEASRMLTYEMQVADNELDIGAEQYSAQVEQAIEHVHDMVLEAAAELGIRVSITAYQLHRNPSLRVLGQQRARSVIENMLLVGVNPSPSEYRFVTDLRGHPLRRTVIAFTSAETLTDMARILGTAQVPITNSTEEKMHTIPRVFGVYIPPNEEQAADNFQQNKTIISKALAFPHINPLLVEGEEYMELQKLCKDNRESQPDFRNYFVEKYTDQ